MKKLFHSDIPHFPESDGRWCWLRVDHQLINMLCYRKNFRDGEEKIIMTYPWDGGELLPSVQIYDSSQHTLYAWEDGMELMSEIMNNGLPSTESF